jgi:iron complex transport system permease protein
MSISASGQVVLAQYARITRRRLFFMAALVLIVLLALLADLCTGQSGLTIGQIWSAVVGDEATSRSTAVIIWQIRLPTALMALLVGMALSLAGAEMQTILDNPLASPFTLGISAAAALGAALMMVLGVGVLPLPVDMSVAGNAFLFAFLCTLFLQFITSKIKGGPEVLVLFGIALVFSFNALLALLQFVASADALQQLVFWSMGSLGRATWPAIAIVFAVVCVTLPFSFRACWQMNALRMGEERARSYGIDVARLRFYSLLRVSLLAGAAVAFTGTIGFVGLVGPHIARMLIGEDHRFFLPASALAGALMMIAASVASKAIIPGVLLPIGIVTSLVGLPIFFVLIFRRWSKG